MKRAKHDFVTLDWGDDVGFIRRSLPIAWACPQCGTKAFRRIDTTERCTHPLYRPVECRRCTPLSWYAWPKATASSAATVAAAPRRTLRARVRGAVVGLVAGWRGA